jgi:hypothetical protein
MEHDESLAFKKRNITSSWTMQALVALCTKTYELPGRRRNEPKPTEEDEPEVAFVRRFVLEHALRSFKEANASTEPLDVKYSKLMSLADLFDKMLSGYSFSQDAGFPNSARQIAKAMFEKHFIPALTASVAEIDLNFPSSKRVIKYILRPINKLTQTAVMLSDNGEISTASSGETEDDEISSATSVSDMEDEREETPDLFRHSTLGMLEPRHEEETSSEESEGEDDEMYDDEYDDEMDYDEDVPEDDGEVVSDEEDMGPIEGLPGDAVEVIIDDEDDEDDDDDDDSGDESDGSVSTSTCVFVWAEVDTFPQDIIEVTGSSEATKIASDGVHVKTEPGVDSTTVPDGADATAATGTEPGADQTPNKKKKAKRPRRVSIDEDLPPPPPIPTIRVEVPFPQTGDTLDFNFREIAHEAGYEVINPYHYDYVQTEVQTEEPPTVADSGVDTPAANGNGPPPPRAAPNLQDLMDADPLEMERLAAQFEAKYEDQQPKKKVVKVGNSRRD